MPMNYQLGSQVPDKWKSFKENPLVSSETTVVVVNGVFSPWHDKRRIPQKMFQLFLMLRYSSQKKRLLQIDFI